MKVKIYQSSYYEMKELLIIFDELPFFHNDSTNLYSHKTVCRFSFLYMLLSPCLLFCIRLLIYDSSFIIFTSKLSGSILHQDLFFIIIILLFICAYKTWVISPPCPHPLPYHPLRPLPPPPTPQYPAETILPLFLILL
jgi:hypothetical protein